MQLDALRERAATSTRIDPRFCPTTHKRIVELSHSGLNSLSSCPRRFAFRKIILNHRSEWQETDATAVGTAVHEGVQEYMRSRDVDAAVHALALHHPHFLKDKTKASTYDLEASVWTLLQIIENSDLPSYELATFLKDGAEHKATEIAFLVIIEFETVIFHLRGFIDLVLMNPLTGRFLPVDIKTTTPQGLGTMQPKYRYDWQVTSYGIPLNALLGNTGSFDVGVFGVIMSDREPKFEFPIYERRPHDLEKYQFYLFDKCKQILGYLDQEDFPRHPQSCYSFGRLCHYHQQCSADNLHEMQMLVNPSMDPGKIERPFDPIITARFEGE